MLIWDLDSPAWLSFLFSLDFPVGMRHQLGQGGSMAKLDKQKTRWYKKWWGILIIVTIVLYFGSALLLRFTTDPSAPKKAEPSAESSEEKRTTPKSEPKESSINYISPRWEITKSETVGFKYIVSTGYLINETGETGIADCNIEFYDREIEWAGGKGFGGQTLKPGERYDFTVQTEVTDTRLISKQNIQCEDGLY